MSEKSENPEVFEEHPEGEKATRCCSDFFGWSTKVLLLTTRTKNKSNKHLIVPNLIY